MAQTKHVTLSAVVVATVTLETNAGRIEVLNRDGTAEVWFTTDNSTPVAEADDVHIVPQAMTAVEVSDETSGQNTVVKLLCTTTQRISVRAL